MVMRKHPRRHEPRCRAHPDIFEPEVIVGPTFRYRSPEQWWHWNDDDLARRRVNGRWLSARTASQVQWGSAIAVRGSRRQDQRARKLRRMSERGQLARWRDIPF